MSDCSKTAFEMVHSPAMHSPQKTATELLDWIEAQRRAVRVLLDPEKQKRWGQYFTPVDVARLMSSAIAPRNGSCVVLDPGAGIGVLAAAAVVRLCESSTELKHIRVVAYEVDPELVPRLRALLGSVGTWARRRGVDVMIDVRERDFLEHAAELARSGACRFADVAILNPPYGKIAARSTQREWAAAVGVETPNVYAAFWAAALKLTVLGGDVVAITPRSFCNGSYFKRFRGFLLAEGAVRWLHVFEARDKAFADDEVLQENLVTHVRVGDAPCEVKITAQAHPGAPIRRRTVPWHRVVQPADGARFIHVVPDDDSDLSAEIMSSLTTTLDVLGLSASTGRIVDFRARELLRPQPEVGTAPLIHPGHLRDGRVIWPRPAFKKANAIDEAGAATRGLLVPDGDYVLVKRFTAKEERRRVVAALYEGDASGARTVGLENHLNYLHAEGRPLSREMAVGLVIYLNSTPVDHYFRQFSGHTQVNAGDLRSLRYPTAHALKEAGAHADLARLGEQAYVDEMARSCLLPSLIARRAEGVPAA